MGSRVETETTHIIRLLPPSYPPPGPGGHSHPLYVAAAKTPALPSPQPSA